MVDLAPDVDGTIASNGEAAGWEAGVTLARWYSTPTGEPCPRTVRLDGSIEGSGDCTACGCCLLLLRAAWPEPAGGDGSVLAGGPF